jgi:hypothetical protein
MFAVCVGLLLYPNKWGEGDILSCVLTNTTSKGPTAKAVSPSASQNSLRSFSWPTLIS